MAKDSRLGRLYFKTTNMGVPLPSYLKKGLKTAVGLHLGRMRFI